MEYATLFQYEASPDRPRLDALVQLAEVPARRAISQRTITVAATLHLPWKGCADVEADGSLAPRSHHTASGGYGVQCALTGDLGYAKPRGVWQEKLASDLAAMVGVPVPEIRLDQVEGKSGIHAVTVAFGKESIDLRKGAGEFRARRRPQGELGASF